MKNADSKESIKDVKKTVSRDVPENESNERSTTTDVSGAESVVGEVSNMQTPVGHKTSRLPQQHGMEEIDNTSLKESEVANKRIEVVSENLSGDKADESVDKEKQSSEKVPTNQPPAILRRQSSSMLLKISTLPKVNCQEKIFLCIDHSDEMFKNKFATHSANPTSVFKTLMSAVRQFIFTKSYLNKKNQFSLILLNEEPQLITDLSPNHEELLFMLNDIAEMPGTDCVQSDGNKTFDMSKIFRIILDQSGLSGSPRHTNRTAPSYVIRVVFLYGRSNTKIEFTDERKIFHAVMRFPQFFLDCIYIHEVPNKNNMVESIFSDICGLDVSGTSHVHEVGTDRNMACLFNVFAKLLAHPLQRQKQGENAIEYELKPESIR